MKQLKYLSLGLFLVGAAFLLPALVLLFNSGKLVLSGAKTQGHVVEVLPSDPSSTKRLARQLVLEFETASGQTLRFEDSAHSEDSPHAVGQTFQIVYDPTVPSKAAINQFRSLWFAPLQLGVMGLAFWLFSFVFRRAVEHGGQASSAQP